MFSHLLCLNGLFPDFGKRSLTRDDLCKIIDILCGSHCTDIDIIFREMPKSKPSELRYTKQSDTYEIHINNSFFSEEQQDYFLAKELGHIFFHGPEPIITSRKDRKLTRKLGQTMNEEAIYFALCCFIPGQKADELWDKYSGDGASVKSELENFYMPTLLNVDFSKEDFSLSHLAFRRVQGHKIFINFLNGYPGAINNLT